jgi:hypothetical protein
VSPCGGLGCSRLSKDQKRDCSQGSPATVRGNSNSDNDSDNKNNDGLKERQGVGEEERGTFAGSTDTDTDGIMDGGFLVFGVGGPGASKLPIWH